MTNGTPVMTVWINRKCTSCGKYGATDSDLCLECVSKLATLDKLTGGNMGLREIPMDGKKEGEQLIFPGIELGEVVREIALIDFQKKEANEEWNDRLKALKKRMFAIAAGMKGKEDGVGVKG